MIVTQELMQCIRAGLESLSYGELKVVVAEKGSFVEVQITEKFHIEKVSVNIPVTH